jgi:hypothetical protein
MIAIESARNSQRLRDRGPFEDPLAQAAKHIVPVAKADPEAIEKLHRLAH